MKRLWLALLVLLLGVFGSQAQEPSSIAIRNARVHTVSGTVLTKGTVLVKNGLIEAVGENLAIPADAWVIEGEGMSVYPGLIDAMSSVGIDAGGALAVGGGFGGRGGGGGGPLTAIGQPVQPAPAARGPEDRPRTFSWERAADKLRTNDPRIEAARNAGFTTAAVFPMSGIFAGQGALINLGGENAPRMVVQSPVGQYVSLSRGARGSRGFPSSLMGIFAYIRQTYIDIDHYKKQKESYDKDPKGKTRPQYDRALEGLIDSPRLLMPAASKSEMERILRFADEVRTPMILYGAAEGFAAADLLKRSGFPVLVSTKWPVMPADANPDEEETMETLILRDRAPTTAAELAKAQVKFAFTSDGQTPNEMMRAVRQAIARGLAPEAALRALTMSPAEIYGVSDRLGSIEKGKIANLVVTKNDLLSERPQVQFVFVDGVKYTPPPPVMPTKPSRTEGNR